jgi:hypothetical protein
LKFFKSDKSAKKFLLYGIVIFTLVLTSFVAREVAEVWDRLDNPDRYIRETPAPRASSPAPDTPNTQKNFARPLPGERGAWSVPELAWILRERIELNVMEALVGDGDSSKTPKPLEIYNGRVEEYNALASVIEYRERDMRAAEDLVEGEKAGIVRDAFDEALDMTMPERVREARDGGEARDIWTVQKFLKIMGLYQGALSGSMDSATEYAVKMFQIGAGAPVTGRADAALAKSLRDLWIARNTPDRVGF